MVLLKITNIDGANEYTLEDAKSKKTYELMIEFHDGVVPMVGDELMLDKSLLDSKSENFVQPYAFGLESNVYGKSPEKLEEVDSAVLVSGDKNIILKRLYG